MGVVGFVLLFWLMTLFDRLLLGWTRLFFLIVIALLLSARAGRRWTLGREPERSFTRKVHPTVAVEGTPGSTYVLLEPAKKGINVRPREFSPLWWTLYTVVVRAPVSLGDFLLTAFWRLIGGRWEASGIGGNRNFQTEDFDFANEMAPPDQRDF